MTASGTFNVQLLGPLALQRDALPLPVSSWRPRARTLFLLLLTAPHHRRSREELIDLLWPDAAPESGSHNLRFFLHALRRSLAEGLTDRTAPSPLLSEQGWVALNPAYRWEIDLERFEQLLREGREEPEGLREAAALYRGEPLAEERYEDWAVPVRERIRRQWRELCLRLAGLAREGGELEEAAGWLERVLAEDPVDEEVGRELVGVLAAQGKRVEALRRYGELERALAEELGVGPMPETVAVVARLKETEPAVAPVPLPVVAPPPPQEVESTPIPDLTPVLLTFLIADVRGYTSFTAHRGNEAAARLASTFAALAEEVVTARNGHLIELRGDEALAVFQSPRQALYAGVDLQRRFRAQTAIEPSLPLEVGIGIDAGEAIPVRGGYRGHALNLAARLCSLAAAGEVYASEGVVRLVSKLEGLAYLELGRAQLKGFAEPVRVIEILPEDDLPDGLPPPPSWLVDRPSNLPLQATPFLGREREVAVVTGLLRLDAVRLLTLTGPGGSGKTRLALQVGGFMLQNFEHGVFFISLASIDDPNLIIPTIASVLNVSELPHQSLSETLRDYLHDKQLLLILDNFEHVLGGAPEVSDLLAACSRLNVLVTSRAVLRLSGEYEYPVPPLPAPDPRNLPPLDVLSQNQAVALFVERARAVKAGFAITEQNAEAVAGICHRLDGLPLAIELAAARTRLLPPATLLARLSSRLTLLTGGSRDAPGRQRSLRATIDWSYSLLTEEEQQLFTRLGVFHGGCTLEAAEAVCNAGGDLDLLDGLESLVEKSLLRQEGDDAPRFLMLETIREYALERLEAGGAECVRDQHAQYYLGLAEEAEPELEGAHHMYWLDRLEADHDNLRAALARFLERCQVERELRLAGALRRFWHANCHFTEGRRWLEAGLARSEAAPVPVRVKALEVAGTLAIFQEDQTRGIVLTEELLRLAREQSNWPAVWQALTTLGMAAIQRGNGREAMQYLEEGLSLARTHEIRSKAARSLYNLGLAKNEAAMYAEAIACIEEAMGTWRDEGETFWVMNALGSLGYIALLEGRYREAWTYLLEYLENAQQFGDKVNVAGGLEGIAALAAAQDRADAAARLFAAAESLRQEIGCRLMSLRNRGMIERWRSSAREQLGERAWQAAWDEVRGMSLEQVVAVALATDAAEVMG